MCCFGCFFRFVGARRCDIIDYYSDDTKLVCRTQMLHKRNNSAADRYRVIVGLNSYTATSFATCTDNAGCYFEYRDDATPVCMIDTHSISPARIYVVASTKGTRFMASTS